MSKPPRKTTARDTAHWQFAGFVVAIVLLTLVAYHQTFSYPFHFDGAAHIDQLANKASADWASQLLRSRGLVDISWATNRSIGGEETFTYHVVNISIHIATAILLLLLIKATLHLPGIPERYRKHATLVGGCIALIWAVHPLQTQSVTYIVQRYESAMGLFFVLSIFCFAQSLTSRSPLFWRIGCVVACYGAGLCKEVAVVLPFVLLWYDRVFSGDPWRTTLQKRWGLYAGCLASWLLYFHFLWTPKRSLQAGNVVYVSEPEVVNQQVEQLTITPWEYLLSQAHAIVLYLHLCFVPVGQNIDHGWKATRSLSEAFLPGLVVLSLLGLTIWAIFRYPRWSFLGAWFFLILAPTSSILPIRDIVFEHRMYLPSMAVIAFAGLLLFELCSRAFSDQTSTSAADKKARNSLLLVSVCVSLLFCGITVARNEVYQSKLALWLDVTEKAPRHGRGFYGLARAYAELDRPDLAVQHLQTAIRLNPSDAGAYVMLGGLVRKANPDAAKQLFAKAIELRPEYSEAHNNLGAMLARSDPQSAREHYLLAITYKPENADAHLNWGNWLANNKQFDEAIKHYRIALSIRPDFSLAEQNLRQVEKMQAASKAPSTNEPAPSQ